MVEIFPRRTACAALLMLALPAAAAAQVVYPQGGYPQPQGGFSQPPQGQAGPGQRSQMPLTPAQTNQITCSRCQASQPAGSNFCASCGNDLRAATTATQAKCYSCGSVLSAGARFCTSCGRSQD